MPSPTACIVVADDVVGWVDSDTDPEHGWLDTGEVNIGYNVFPRHRGHGYATRALQLLMHRLAVEDEHKIGTLLINPENTRSVEVARRAGFSKRGNIDGQLLLKRTLPRLSYTDGVVTIRRQDPENDLEPHLAAIDNEQVDWLWAPGDREAWEALSPTQQRTHQHHHLQQSHEEFATGPHWRFSGDLVDAPYVVYVDCDLANENAPHGEANISYTTHPTHRGQGYTVRAVRLVLEFVREHTGATTAYFVIDVENGPSLGVARSVGASETVRHQDAFGRTKLTFSVSLRPRA
ncbi:MAG: GNAT family N-acetyltransferase [Acidimicrobiales bacterium]